VVAWSLVVWIGVVVAAYFLPANMRWRSTRWPSGCRSCWGGTQALSRSLFAGMIPRGKEAEYFSLYEVSVPGAVSSEHCCSGFALQNFGSYRVAIVSLMVFFVVGLVLLARGRRGAGGRGGGQRAAGEPGRTAGGTRGGGCHGVKSPMFGVLRDG